jgi:hypothetical protein
LIPPGMICETHITDQGQKETKKDDKNKNNNKNQNNPPPKKPVYDQEL